LENKLLYKSAIVIEIDKVISINNRNGSIALILAKNQQKIIW
jgi:hypothetical protein